MDSQQSWPKGLSDEVAVIDADIPQLESDLGVQFCNGVDDLDDFQYRIFHLNSGTCALMRYKNSPRCGVTMIVRSSISQNMQEHVDDLLKELRLTERPIVWRRPDEN